MIRIFVPARMMGVHGHRRCVVSTVRSVWMVAAREQTFVIVKFRPEEACMSEPIDAGAKLCANCGQKQQDHWLANYADGPSIGREFLVCPTATFRIPREHGTPPPAGKNE